MITATWFCIAFLLTYTTLLGQGSQATNRKKLDLNSFSSLGVEVNANVWITQGKNQEVWVDGPQALIDRLHKQVKNDTWTIKYDDFSIKPNKQITIHITMPRVRSLAVAGSGKIMSRSNFKNEETLSFSVAGSGVIAFAGTADEIKISIAGSGNVQTKDLNVRTAKVSIAGSGDCFLEVSESLEVSIAGSGSIFYGGNPKIKSSIAGSGKVVPKN